MNSSDNNLIEILKDLKENFGAISAKIEFETEGASIEDVQKLKNIADIANIDLALKIGGCEDKRDIFDAKKLEIKTIIAPMIETEYALQKFVLATKEIFSKKEEYLKHLYFINIETITGYNNLDKIISSEYFKYVNGCTFGRNDFIKSINLGQEQIENEKIFEIAENIAQKIKEKEKYFCIGGKILSTSVDFLNAISYVTHFETRKIIFNTNILNKNNYLKALFKAFEFEILWLKNKSNITQQNIKRIDVLKKELNKIN